MSNHCINYKFCKGIAFPELDENLCLLCCKWYTEGEGWGPIEFIENDEDCAVCYSKGTKMKFPTNCGHSFCIQCSRNLLSTFIQLVTSRLSMISFIASTLVKWLES